MPRQCCVLWSLLPDWRWKERELLLGSHLTLEQIDCNALVFIQKLTHNFQIKAVAAEYELEFEQNSFN